MEERLSRISPVDTVKLSDKVLEFLSRSSQTSFQLHQRKPSEVTQTFTTSFNPTKKQLQAQASRYQNQIRKSSNQHFRIHVSADSSAGSFTIPATITSSRGNKAQLATDGHLSGKTIAAITVSGREDITAVAEKREQVILMILQGKIDAEGTGINPWCQYIFLHTGENFAWPTEWVKETTSIQFKPKAIPRPLNASQIDAIHSMLQQTNDSRVTIIQGPPGTGKTTVIASFVQTAIAAGKRGIWLIAQSNIAVKNIAEKLADFNLLNWKLLVSNQFYEFWHEHLYTTIKTNTIISEDFQDSHLLFSKLSGCPVILCTLSMLSSFMLHKLGVFRDFPLQTVVIDEASQIEIGDYIPLFNGFTTIRKVIFIGDDKQLPPHGQEDVKELQSIFEVEHLKSQITFLNTQYRMPPQIGKFISQAVYQEQLLSNSGHPLADTGDTVCHFVNVAAGQQISQGTSLKNVEECKAILLLASIFQAEHKSFKIITPYDAQRTLLENALKEAELEWGDTCFNVDSFQGLLFFVFTAFEFLINS
ncbi:P-loop containing nucleoside triphosphate hydrolase protein [Phlebopus sp. FC_14]|nr:P-loop containing nucleoside triphosphate hydrolase protein [Phlebopus sp. FC_14]